MQLRGPGASPGGPRRNPGTPRAAPRAASPYTFVAPLCLLAFSCCLLLLRQPHSPSPWASWAPSGGAELPGDLPFSSQAHRGLISGKQLVDALGQGWAALGAHQHQDKEAGRCTRGECKLLAPPSGTGPMQLLAGCRLGNSPGNCMRAVCRAWGWATLSCQPLSCHSMGGPQEAIGGQIQAHSCGSCVMCLLRPRTSRALLMPLAGCCRGPLAAPPTPQQLAERYDPQAHPGRYISIGGCGHGARGQDWALAGV